MGAGLGLAPHGGVESEVPEVTCIWVNRVTWGGPVTNSRARTNRHQLPGTSLSPSSGEQRHEVSDLRVHEHRDLLFRQHRDRDVGQQATELPAQLSLHDLNRVSLGDIHGSLRMAVLIVQPTT